MKDGQTEGRATVEFTNHQIQIIKYWADLKTTALAAEALGVKEQTILTHLRRMRMKVGVKRTVDVLIHLQDRGLL